MRELSPLLNNGQTKTLINALDEQVSGTYTFLEFLRVISGKLIFSRNETVAQYKTHAVDEVKPFAEPYG